MASSGTYPDPDAQMGPGAGLFVNQNGTPPSQQQQHMASDPELQLQEHLGGHLQRNADMLHAAAQQGHSLNPALNQFHTPPRPTHSPQQLAQSVMGLEEHNPYGEQDGTRKRSKVSRACDECRRKKIRCDATSENGPEACSSCKRTGARCQFSRQPMKRGPSKGYIKELADRLNSLEHQIQNPNTPTQSFEPWMGDQGLGDAQTPSHFVGRKRTHSMSEGLQDQYNRPGWGIQDRDYATNGNSQTFQRQPSYSDLALAGSLITGANDSTLKAYYATIHQTLPVLPYDASSLNRLGDCPPKLRESFFLALEAGVRSISSSNLPPLEGTLPQLSQRSLELLDDLQDRLNDPDTSRQLCNHIVYCQTLVFLILAADKPGSVRASDLLARLAVKLDHFDLNDSQTLDRAKAQDYESFEAARRLFWVSFILDRFHASSRTRNTCLPLHCGSLSKDDFNALGETTYHLARAADIVGQIGYVIRAGQTPNNDLSSPYAPAALTASSPTALYLDGQLSRYKESLDITNLPSNSAPLLAFQYVRILVARQSVFASSNEVLAFTRELLNNLINSITSPIHHIFAGLVATSLVELADRVETQVEAHAGIKEMSDAISNGRILYRSDGTGWDVSIRDQLHQKRAPTPSNTEQAALTTEPNMAGLQHLAAAAVGEREGGDAPRPTSSSGNADLKPEIAAAIAAATEAAAAQATAAAAQKQMSEARKTSGNNSNNAFESASDKDAFISALT